MPCFTNNRMIGPTLFLYDSLLICFVFWVQNNFRWLWEHWQPQFEFSQSSVPAVASCATYRETSPPDKALDCLPGLLTRNPLAASLLWPLLELGSSSVCCQLSFKSKKLPSIICLQMQERICQLICIRFVFLHSHESCMLPLSATYGKTVTIIQLTEDIFLLFSVVLMVLEILQKYEINFFSLHRISSSKN